MYYYSCLAAPVVALLYSMVALLYNMVALSQVAPDVERELAANKARARAAADKQKREFSNFFGR